MKYCLHKITKKILFLLTSKFRFDMLVQKCLIILFALRDYISTQYKSKH